jgi:polyisoprenyl-phosphate glycosyltransferase
MTTTHLSIIIPCYNEESVLSELIKRLNAVCSILNDKKYEILLINDGSTDNTWNLINEFANNDSHIVGVNLSRNYGHQLALSAGLKLCRGKRVFILDADLQDPPELLNSMMEKMDEGADVVYGQRRKREGETVFKKITAYLFYRILNSMIDIKIPQDTGDFRLMSRKAVDAFNKMPEQDRFIRGMISWIGLNQVPLPYDRASRFSGETKYPFSKMLKFAIDAITGFSIRPLKIASMLGIGFGCLTILILLYILYNYYFGYSVKGWTSLAVIILAIGSAQLFVTGIVGEYLGRLYLESKGRPLYILKEIVSSDPNRKSE